jgi:hypothetical protein
MKRLVTILRALLIALLASPVMLMAACEPGELDDGKLCSAGENIFCRCRGGDPGTKQCRDDGQGFETCFGEYGACEEAAAANSGDPLEEEDSGGYKDLLSPCEKSDECQSNMCRMGYCTKPCGNWQECTFEDDDIWGDCITIDGAAQHCVPYCGSQADCDAFGSPSTCGYAIATDVVPVQVCADWSGLPPLPPEGAACFDDYECHLGHAGRQYVCAFGVCIGGCHEDADCPQGESCNVGSPGSCE